MNKDRSDIWYELDSSSLRRWHRRPILGLLAFLALAACGAPTVRGLTATPSPRLSPPGATPNPTADTLRATNY